MHERLADNFDTAEAIKVLNELVTMTNSYLQQDKSLIKLPLVRQISKYVFKILKVFGVYDEDVFPSQLTAAEESDQAASYEDMIAPLMNVLSKFRDTIKAQAD